MRIGINKSEGGIANANQGSKTSNHVWELITAYEVSLKKFLPEPCLTLSVPGQGCTTPRPGERLGCIVVLISKFRRKKRPKRL